MSRGKNIITTKIRIESTGKDKEMKNDERDENSPIEMIEGRLKTSVRMKIDARKRLRLREEEGGRAGKQKHLEGESTNILKRKHRLK